MKSIMIAVLALLGGLVAGAWGPRSDLIAARNQAKELKGELADCGRKPSPVLSGVTQMLGIAGKGPTRSEPPGKSPAELPRDRDPQEEDGPLAMEPESDRGALDDAERLEEALQVASDLWNIRREHALEILVESLDLDVDGIDGFEKSMRNMNEALSEEIERIVDSLADGEEPSAEEGFRLAHSISGIVLDAYVDMDSVLPENWRENITPDAEPINFIDPMVISAFLELDPEMFSYTSDYEDGNL